MLALPQRFAIISRRGPDFDLNLLNGVLPSYVTFTRAGTATDGLYTDSSGSSYNSYSTDVPRIFAGRGLLVEESQTNYLLNSASPVTQTTAALAATWYTAWMIGSGSMAITQGATPIGTATAGAPVLFSAPGSATYTATVTGSVNRFQINNGATATSFIPTAGTTVTRAADVARLSPIPWFLVGARGTLWCEFQSVGMQLSQTQVASIGKGASSVNDGWRLRIGGATDTVNGAVLNGSTVVATTALGNIDHTKISRMACAYLQPGMLVALNGTLSAQETTGVLGSGQDTLGIGTPETTQTPRMNGYIRRIKYWSRVLSGPELMAETAR
jgi:hypothetical protein